MKTIAIANQKGGTAKTTTTAALSVVLSRSGTPVHMIDMDPQASLTRAFGASDDSDGLYNALASRARLPLQTVSQNLSLTSATIELGRAETELLAEPGREFFLKTCLQRTPLPENAGVFLDCPPSLGVLSVNCLASAGGMIAVVQPGSFELHALVHLHITVQAIQDRVNPDLHILADPGPLRSVSADAKLGLGRVGGKEVDVGQVGGVAIAEVGDQFAEAGERACARRVGNEVGLHGGVILDLLDDRIELGPFGRVVERRRIQQAVLQDGAQLVLGGHVQPFDRRPSEVVVFRGHRGLGLIGGRRRAPEGDDKLLLRPPYLVSGFGGACREQGHEQNGCQKRRYEHLFDVHEGHPRAAIDRPAPLVGMIGGNRDRTQCPDLSVDANPWEEPAANPASWIVPRRALGSA